MVVKPSVAMEMEMEESRGYPDLDASNAREE